MNPRLYGTAPALALAFLTMLVATTVAAPSLLSQSLPAHSTSSSLQLSRPAGPTNTLFVENIGQWNRSTSYAGTAGSARVHFDAGGVSYSYLVDSLGVGGRGGYHVHTLRTEFLDARRDPTISGELISESHFNYYLGSGPVNWHLSARAYERVRYSDIYHRIDALYYSREGRMKYDFIIEPGGDPSHIRLRYNGAIRLEIGDGGVLEVVTPFGSVKEDAPYCYQMIDGNEVEVAGRYRLLGDDRYGFQLGRYDRRFPVVIDPCLSVEYASYLGGGGYDIITSVATDSSGNAYATGFTRAPDFPSEPQQPQFDGKNYVFVSKFSPDGSRLLYSTVIAQTYQGPYDLFGSFQNYESIGEDIEVTRDGSAVVAMNTNINGLPTSSTSYQDSLSKDDINSRCGPPSTVNFDLYVTRLDASGKVAWGSYLGGKDNDYVTDIALDGSGNVFLTGITYAPRCGSEASPRGDTSGFPVTIPKSAFSSPDSLRGFETFVSQISSNGRALPFSAIYGGAADEFAGRIALDGSGNIVLIGSTNSTNLVTSTNAYQRFRLASARQDVFDLYIAKIDPAAGTLLYSSYFADNAGPGRTTGLGFGGYVAGIETLKGFERQERRQGLIVRPSGNEIVFAGTTRSPGLPLTANPFQPALRNPTTTDAGYDLFVVRMDISSNAILASTYLGGSDFDALGGITFEKFGDIAIALSTRSADFPLSAVNIQAEMRGAADGVIATISPDAKTLTYATFIGGSAAQAADIYEQTVAGITADNQGALYIFGGTSSQDFPVTPNAAIRETDYYGGYIVKFTAPGAAKIGTSLDINFQPDLCGGPQSERLVIFNSGQSPLRIDSLKFLKQDHFSLGNAPPLPHTLSPCDTLVLDVIFDGTKMECKTRTTNALLIAAPGAAVSHVLVPVSGSRRCNYFTFNNDSNSVIVDYKLGSGLDLGFPVYLFGDDQQYLSLRPHPSNKGIFIPITPDSARYGVGTSNVAFRVNVPDTGYYCERFTAIIDPCGRTKELTLCAYVRAGIYQTPRDTIDFGLVSCRDIPQPVIVRNVGNDVLTVRVLYVGGSYSTDIFFETPPDLPVKIQPQDSLVYVPVIRPVGYGKREAVVVFLTDEGNAVVGRQRWVKLRYELDSAAFRLTTPATIARGNFGDILEMPVEYEPLLEARTPIEELSFFVKFDPSVLAITGISTGGTRTDGWQMVQNKTVDSGEFILLKRAGSSPGVSGAGRLVNLKFKVLRGSAMESPYDIKVSGATSTCFYSEIDSGRIFQLNEECAAEARLLFNNRQLLRQSMPNPAAASVTIPFRIPDEGGYATLVIYDLGGREVLRLIDEQRKGGEDEIEFDSRRLSPGLYYYRLTVGTSIAETRTMIIER